MSSLSQDDIDTLASIGHDTTQTIVCLVVEAIMYTFFFVLVVIAGRILMRKRSKLSMTMFGVILIMFLLDTAMCVLDVNNAIRELTLTLTSTSPLSLSDRYELTFNLPYSVTNSLFAYMICFGDVVIVWRAYTFWCYGKERLMMILPALPLLGTFVTASVVSFCVAREVSENEPDNLVNPPFCHNVQQAMYSTSLVTTAIATALTCYKTWLYRREIGARLSGNSKKTRTEKVMLILIESGVLYFLLALEFVVGDIPKVSNAESAKYNLAFADLVWTYMTSHILGIYPALMVILVNSQRSYLEESVISTHIESTHMGSNRLGSATAYTSSAAGSKKNLSTMRTGHTTTHTIEIDVHESHEMDSVPDRTVATLPGSLGEAEVKDAEKAHSFV